MTTYDERQTTRVLTAREMINPDCGDPRLLTRSPPHCIARVADLKLAPARPGSLAALDCPSRIGDRLHYRDGRILPFPFQP
jgi:hypothetical protein